MSLATTPPVPGFLHEHPDDWEFYLEGRIEGKRPAEINPDDAKMLREMGLDKLVGPGAWDSYKKPVSSNQAAATASGDSKNEKAGGSEKN